MTKVGRTPTFDGGTVPCGSTRLCRVRTDAIHAGPGCVDAVAGAYEAVVGHQVGRGHAQLAAALVAVHHLALEEKGLAQKGHRLPDLTGSHQAADLCGGHRLALHLYQRCHVRLELRVGAQQLLGALGALAEAEVLAHRDPLGAQPRDQHLVDELLRALGGEARVERDHNELLHAEPGDQVALHGKGVEQLRGGLGVDHRQRVRIEGQDRVAAADDLAVPEMHPVEGADGHAARPVGRVDVG